MYCNIIYFFVLLSCFPMCTALYPPALPPFLGNFEGITNILQSDVLVYIIKLILTRSTARWSKSWSESQLEMVSSPVSANFAYQLIIAQPLHLEKFLFGFFVDMIHEPKTSLLWKNWNTPKLRYCVDKIGDIFFVQQTSVSGLPANLRPTADYRLYFTFS